MNLSASSLRTDTLMLLCAAAMTAAGVAGALAPSLLAQHPTPAEQRAELDARKKDASALDSQVAAAQAALARLRSQNRETPQLRPPSKINDRLMDITKLAEKSRVVIAQLNPVADAKQAPETGEPAAAAVSRVIAIKLSGSGSYPDITAFLHDIHEQLHDTGVIGIHLDAAPDQPGSTHAGQGATFNIDLAWHASLSDATPPTGPSSQP